MKRNQLLLIAATAWTLGACQSGEPTEVVNNFQGKVKKEMVSIAPKVPGRIEQILVEEGSNVQKGDTLAIIDVPEVEAKVKQAKGAVLAAQGQYDMAKSGATPEQRRMVTAALNAAEEQYNFAQKSFKRLESLYLDSLLAAQQYDEVKMKYLGAKAQYEGAKAKYQEVTGQVRAEKIQMALGTLQRAEGALQEALTAQSERYIIAPADIQIESISLKEGELSLPGYSLFTAYRSGNTYFRFTLSEKYLADYQKGKTYAIQLPYAEKANVKAQLKNIKQLHAYANKTAAYPAHELGEAMYELEFYPVKNLQEALWLDNMTVVLTK